MELQVIDITIGEANNKIEHLDSLIEYYQDEQDLYFIPTQPGAVDTTRTSVSGGKREDKFLNYAIDTQSPEYIEWGSKKDLALKQKQNLVNYINRELKRLNEYDPVAKRIIELREIKRMTWKDISISVNLCQSYCRELYKEFIFKRYVN